MKQNSKDKIILTYIAGFCKQCRKPPYEEEVLSLQPEPENPFDSNAIAIYNSKGQKLGYVPSKNGTNKKKLFKKKQKRNFSLFARVVESDKVCVVIQIYLDSQSNSKAKNESQN